MVWFERREAIMIMHGHRQSGWVGRHDLGLSAWLKLAAILLGLVQGGLLVVLSSPSAGDVVAVVILVGAWLAWRHPVLMGGLLVLLGAVLTPSLVWAIDFGSAWT